MTLESLQALVAAFKAAGGQRNGYITLCVGSDPGITDALAAHADAKRSEHTTDCVGRPIRIYSAKVEIDGIQISAQWSRDATPMEIAEFTRPTTPANANHEELTP